MTNDEIQRKLLDVHWRVRNLITDSHLMDTSSWIAGGAIVDLANDVTPQDYDYFFSDEAVVKAWQARLSDPDPLPRTEILAKTENGITLKLDTGEVIQLVTRFIGEPSRVFDDFDYTHTKCYWRPARSPMVSGYHESELVLNRELIEGKLLRFDGHKEKFALNTLKRFGKFVSRGWKPDNDCVMNLYRAIQKSPSIDDPEEHKRQTVGFYGSSHK